MPLAARLARHRATVALSIILALALISGARPPLRAQTTDNTPRPIVLTHANVIDGVGDRPIMDATVVLANGRIERVAAGILQAPNGALVIDMHGRWVLPGLIDAHTHISNLAAARRALESGVTTVRSASTANFQDIGLRELVKAGKLAGPDVVASGLFVRQDLGESVLADLRLAPLAGGVNTLAEIRLLVEINLDHGVDVIKTMSTERAGLPNTDPRKQTYTEEQLRVIVETAARKGVPVMVHAHGDEGAYVAVNAGARSIEHGTYLSDSTLRLMVQKGTWLVPTYSTLLDLRDPGGDYDDPILHVRALHMIPAMEKMVHRARELGVKIVTGGDTQYGPASVTRIPHEIIHFVEFGMTPMEAIRSATSAAAECLRVEQKTGSLKPGLEADLIVIEANPLDDIRVIQDVTMVISNGRLALNRLPFAREAK